MATLFTNYNKDSAGHVYVSQTACKLYLGDPKLDGNNYLMYASNVAKSTRIWLTGYYISYGGNKTMYQAINTKNAMVYILSDQISSGDWLPDTTATSTTKYGDGQKLANNLIANNFTILENNLLCAGIISKAEKKGISTPVAVKKQISYLQSRLQQRDEKLLNSALIQSKQTAAPKGFLMYKNELQNVMDTPGVGVAPIIIYIVFSVVITALISYLVYLKFQPDYTDSKADLVMSDALTKAIAKASPEEKAAAIADLEGQVDAAYVKGKTDASFSGILKTAGYLAAGFLGFTLIDKFITNRGNK